MLKAVNIKWEIDLNNCETYTEMLDQCGLPAEVEIPKNITNIEDIADWLSDEYGFCHNGFDIKYLNDIKDNEYMKLSQIKKFIENKEDKEKQIVFTGSNNIKYISDECSDMYLILDKDVDVRQVEFYNDYGLIINNDNSIKENVLLWEEEVEDGGVDVIGALNGILNINLWGYEINLKREICDEILSINVDENYLNKIQTKFGVIYIESLCGSREEEDRIKIYDTDKKYIDYIPLETLQNCADELGITLEEEYANRIKTLRIEYDIRNLWSYISEDIVSWSSNRENFVGEDNDFINRIGDHWVLSSY